MPLGVEVGLNPGDFVFDGDPASPQKGGVVPPIFGPCLLRPNGCMDQDATCYTEVGLSPDDTVLDGDAAPLPKKGTEPFPQFSAHVYCGKQLYGSR